MDNEGIIRTNTIMEYLILTEEIDKLMAKSQKDLYEGKYQWKMTDDEWDQLMKKDNEIIKIYTEHRDRIKPPRCLLEGKMIRSLIVTKDKRLQILPFHPPQMGIRIQDMTSKLQGLSVFQINQQFPHFLIIDETNQEKDHIPRRLMQQYRRSIPKVCPVCGEWFKPGNLNKIYCNKWACKKKAQRNMRKGRT